MKSTVAMLRTRPETILADIHRLMNLAGYQKALPKDRDTGLKINISWHSFFPACSTPPWQLDGVIRSMVRDGYKRERLYGCHNRTVVVDARLGERENKQIHVIEAHGLKNVHLYEGEEWIHIEDAIGSLDELLVLPAVYRKGFHIPKRFIGNNILHLPTVKTHIFTTTTGAMKNAFGGLLNEKRHWTHPVIHETLVDLLRIQQKIHSGIFAVMDGTFAGDGPGPRCMIPHVKNVLLASADQVAIDAAAAHLMGFDPLNDLKYVRLAHEHGLGCGDVKMLDIRGDGDLMEKPWHFVGPFRKMTFAARMQHKIYWGSLKKILEWSLRTLLAPWSYIASIAYHDFFWYPFHQKRLNRALRSRWGRLFRNWETVRIASDCLDAPGWPDVGKDPARTPRQGVRLMLRSFRILFSAVRKAPEFEKRRHS